MILSTDNDLSIGLPISDFVDWSGRELWANEGKRGFDKSQHENGPHSLRLGDSLGAFGPRTSSFAARVCC